MAEGYIRKPHVIWRRQLPWPERTFFQHRPPFSSSAQIHLGSNWRRQEWSHSSYPTMTIHAGPVTWSAQAAACQKATWDFTLWNLRQPEPRLVTPPPPHQPSSPLCIPSPSPVAYVQTGSISAPASFSSQLDSALSPPRIVWVNITPYYPILNVTEFMRTRTVALQIHTNCWSLCTHTHTHTLSKSSSHINGNYMQTTLLVAVPIQMCLNTVQLRMQPLPLFC